MATMRVPKAVTAAALRADELLANLDRPEPDVVEPEATVAPQTPQSTAPQSPEIPPQNVPDLNPAKDEGYWQHRFKTVEGMLNAEKRKTSDLLKDYQSKVDALQSQVNELVTKSAVPKQYDVRNYLSQEDIGSYGEDMPKVMMKMASAIAKESAEEAVTRVIKQELEPVRNQVRASEEASNQERVNGFWKNLQRAVPDWQVTNGDPDFLGWLSEREGFTKFTRDDILKDAERNLDADTVVELFQAFKKSKTAVPSAVQKKVLPESSAQTLPESVDEAPLFTGDQVRKAYNDYARGIYKGKTEEWLKLEAKMNDAIRAGKVS